MAYCTAAEVRAQIQKSDTGDDSTITAIIAAAEEAINNFCNRPDGFVAPGTAVARIFPGGGEAVLWIDECAAVTAVAAKESPDDSSYTAWASTDWLAGSGDPDFPDYNRTPYQWIRVTPGGVYGVFPASRWPVVQVTAKWGYATTVPDVVKQACITQAARWYKRGQGAWSDTLASADFGMLMFRQQLDPDMAMMLKLGRLIRPVVG